MVICRKRGHLQKKGSSEEERPEKQPLVYKGSVDNELKTDVFSKGRWDYIYGETQRHVIMLIHVLLDSLKKTNNLWGRTKRQPPPAGCSNCGLMCGLVLPANIHPHGLKQLHRFISPVLLIQSLTLSGEYLGLVFFLALENAQSLDQTTAQELSLEKEISKLIPILNLKKIF